MREQNALPYGSWVMINLTAKAAINNCRAGRAAKGANPVIRTNKIDKFRQEFVDFFLLFIKKYKNHKKSWQYPVDKAKIYDILWQTNESERVRLFALF